MSDAADVLIGIAQLLHDNGVATYRPAGGYTSDETAVMFKQMPPAPDRCVLLTTYAVPLDHRLGLQVRTRGLPGAYLDADGLADPIRALLHGRRGLTFGGVLVELLAWQSGSPLGVDANDRDEVSDNYYLTTNRPATSLVDLV